MTKPCVRPYAKTRRKGPWLAPLRNSACVAIDLDAFDKCLVYIRLHKNSENQKLWEGALPQKGYAFFLLDMITPETTTSTTPIAIAA